MQLAYQCHSAGIFGDVGDFRSYFLLLLVISTACPCNSSAPRRCCRPYWPSLLGFFTGMHLALACCGGYLNEPEPARTMRRMLQRLMDACAGLWTIVHPGHPGDAYRR